MAKYSKLISTIRIAELSGLANRMSAYYTEQDLTPYPDYVPFVEDFQRLATELSVALNSDKIESELADLDSARDDAFRAIYYLLHGYTLSSDADTKKAADYMMNIFNKYGLDTVSMSYDGESGNLDSFLTDATDSSLLGVLEDLPGIIPALGNLQDAQEAFILKQNEYDNEYAKEQESKSSASAIKPVLLEALNGKIVNFHLVLADTKDAAFREIAGTIDRMIVEENELTRARKNKQTT